MKTRKSNSYVKTGMYLLIGALAGGVLGAGAYMILSSWGQGFEGTAAQLYSGLQAPFCRFWQYCLSCPCWPARSPAER